MFSTRPMVEHSLRKRLISNVYSKSYIHASPAAAAQARDILFNRMLPILEDSISGPRSLSVIDIYSTFMATTMDFIACYIFGLRNGTDFLREKAYREHFLELYKARNDYGIYDQELPWLTKLCRRLGIPFCPKWVDSANKELGEWCLRLCNRLWDDAPAATTKDNDDDDTSPSPPSSSPSNPADQPVVWTALVSGLRKEEAKNGRSSLLFPTALSNFHLSVASELFDHVLAGQETAGVTLSYLAWRLSQRPNLQRQLREELLTLSPNLRFLANESRASPTPELPDPKHLDHLPLLHAVIMETLRLHAPLPGAEPRQTPPQGCRIGPYHVPGGVRVAAMPYMLHRDETVFPEPEKWDYTRWLPSGGATEEERKQQNRQFWAFSSGGRMCIGSNFAMHGEFVVVGSLMKAGQGDMANNYGVAEMKLIIAAIYSNYTTHIVDDAGMENQSDGYAGRPEHERLFLRLERV
jgi:hypothetical protein